MQRVRVVADTVAQLTGGVVEKYWMKVVPLATIYCDGKVYVEGENITLAEAYKLLAEDPKEFKTSAIAPEYFARAFEELSKTVDEILCVTVSSKLSAGYNNAVIAGKEAMDRMPGLRVRVLDSLSAGGGEGLIALAAARVASKGLGLDAVAAAAEQARQDADCLFVFDTLRYVYRTGRMPKVASQMAGGLGVKPLVQVRRDGKIHFVALFRSRGKAVERALEMVRTRVGDRPVNVIVTHAEALADAERLKARAEAEFDCREIFISEFSPVMGYATGPGVLGIATCPETGMPA